MKKIKNLSFLLLVFLTFSTKILAQKVEWATKLVAVSSEKKIKTNTNQYSARQALGKPTLLPDTRYSPAAWSPATEDNTKPEFIKVSFPITNARQIIVAESYGSGSIAQIIAYNQQDKPVFTWNNERLGQENKSGQMLYIKLDSAKRIFSVKITLQTDRVPGFNQIDAIGISDSNEPITLPISVQTALSIKNKPEKLGNSINSNYPTFAPNITPDGKRLYFSRLDHPENTPSKDSLGKTEYKQDIWFADLQDAEKGTFSKAQNMGAPLNTSGHNASFSISEDGNSMLLNNKYMPDGSLERGLSVTYKENGIWGKPQEVIIESYENFNDFSEFCLSPDGKTIIAAIQPADSQGGKDLYVSIKKTPTTWGKPINIGKNINTAENETSPFLASDNKTLYFASLGHRGYGSYDIFVTRRLDDTWLSWSEPENVGQSINTAGAEMYFSIMSSGEYAYFVSNKNISRVRLIDPLKPAVPVLIIRTLDAKTNQPLFAKVNIIDLEDNKEVKGIENVAKSNEYKIVLKQEKKYRITAESEGHFAATKDINIPKITKYQEFSDTLILTPVISGEKVRLDFIYFARASAELLPESFPELDNLAEILEKNAGTSIMLEGHTEPFGNPKGLRKLAKSRVVSVKHYLVSKKKIAEKRIKIEGYGGDRPITRKDDEKSRQLNRRVEVKVL